MPTFATSADFSRILYATTPSIFRTLPRLLPKPAIAFVDLDSIRHFQPRRSTSRPLKGRSEGLSTARKHDASTVNSEYYDSVASMPKTMTNVNLESCELVGCIDLNTPLPMETGGNPFCERALSWW